jgi:hypothetical protein
MSQVVFIIGNGLNFLVKHIIDEMPIRDLEARRVLRRNALSSNLGEITVLWKKFDKVFEELRQHFIDKGNRISDEELIKLISSVINFFSNLIGFQKVISEEDIAKLRNVFDDFLLRQIVDIANEFRAHESKGAYGSIREYFAKFQAEFDNIVSRHEVKKVYMFTTNYDGIFDVILSKQPTGFIAVDGFTTIEPTSTDESEARVSSKLLKFQPKILQDKKYILCHLHGSYKFIKYFGKTYKIRGQHPNTRPVIVFNRPEAKGYIVSNDNVLSEYMRLLTQSLQSPETKRLVILGNSMEAEPHIKEVIRDNFSSKPGKKEIIIVSRTPERIAQELASHYAGQIILKPVAGINTLTDFTNLFDFLFAPTAEA